MTRRGRSVLVVAPWLFASALSMLAMPPLVALATSPPSEGVAFAPPAGASLPRDARFVDEYNRRVRLGDYLARPVLLVPAYYGCSNLCGTLLSGLAAALESSGLRAGRDVEVVVVSISPLDTASDALVRKRAVLGDGAAAGWHFLTGDDATIGRVTDVLGYRYRFDRDGRQYAHAAGVAVAAMDGRISGVLYGVGFRPGELRHAVTDAGAEAAQAAIEGDARQWLLCFHYDPQTGRYSFAAMSAVRAAGLLALLALVAYALRAWTREWRAKPRRGSPPR